MGLNIRKFAAIFGYFCLLLLSSLFFLNFVGGYHVGNYIVLVILTVCTYAAFMIAEWQTNKQNGFKNIDTALLVATSFVLVLRFLLFSTGMRQKSGSLAALPMLLVVIMYVSAVIRLWRKKSFSELSGFEITLITLNLILLFISFWL